MELIHETQCNGQLLLFLLKTQSIYKLFSLRHWALYLRLVATHILFYIYIKFTNLLHLIALDTAFFLLTDAWNFSCKVHDIEAVVKRFKTDLHNAAGFIQEPKKLKECVKELYGKYVSDDTVSLFSFLSFTYSLIWVE